MCCGPNLNLCRCGCPETEHEEGLDLLSIALTDPAIAYVIPLPMKRGKCKGIRWKPLRSPEELQAAKERGEPLILTEPCDCTEFHPLLEPLCPGIA